MKSRTSFFNKAIYKKNLTLYWPIWVCYLLYGLVKVPGQLWFELHSNGTDEDSVYQALSDSLNLQLDIAVIAGVAVICGMAVFSYLFSTKSAYMIHALPVTRRELFGSNVASGLTFLLVPQVLVFVVTVLLCLANGIACVQYVGIWLLSVMGISTFLFSLVCFCAMITGLLVAVPVFFFVLNYLTLGLAVGMRLIFSLIGYGISFNDTPDISLLRILSPLDYLFAHVSLRSHSTYGLTYSGGKQVLCYAVASLLVFAVSYFGYRKRRSESAGDLLAFTWLKPVFRWGVGLVAGYVAGILMKSLVPQSPMWAVLVLFALVAYYVADMLIQKSFRVFSRSRLRESVLFLGFVAASYGGVCGATYGVENYVPDEAQLASAYLYMNYPVAFEGEAVGEVIRLHREILSQGRQFLESGEENLGDAVIVNVIYHYKNGRKFERMYYLPGDADFSASLTEELCTYEMEPDSFMTYLVGSDYDEITEFEEAQLAYDSEEGDFVTHNIDTSIAKKLYDAVCADAEEGTLQKYNLVYFATEDSYSMQEDSGVYLFFQYYHQSADWEDAFDMANGSLLSHSASDYDEEESRYGYLNLSFGADCANIIRTLCEEGVIRSADDLLFAEAE